MSGEAAKFRADDLEQQLRQQIGPFAARSIGPDPLVQLESMCSGNRGLIHARLRDVRIERGRGVLREQWRNNAFIIVLKHGTIHAIEDGQEFVCHAGDILAVDPDWWSELWAKEDASFLSLSISRHQLTRFLGYGQSISGLAVSGTRGLGRLVSFALHNLVDVFDTLDGRELDAATVHLLGLFEQALILRDGAGDDEEAALLRRMAEWAVGTKERRNVSPAQLAVAFNVSTRSLYRFFARHDLRPSAWLLNLRLEEARRRLSSPSARTSITQIAFEAGFNDASHFSKMFRQAFGFTPTEYRAEVRRDGCRRPSAASQASPRSLGRQRHLTMENMEDPADSIGLQ